ncbi:MAG: phage tail sheath family protein [Planctomycetota bacterium]|nr:phage tail sheath family protein [Planctomycetota bacterium]
MAPEYLSPGIYVEEVDRGSKPIESVGTSTAGIIGSSRKGKVQEPVLITNWDQYTREFGTLEDSQHLAHAVYGFLNNGGRRCFVLNVGVVETRAPEKKGTKAEEPKSDPAGLYVGRGNGPGRRTGVKAFEEIDEIGVVCAPGQTNPAIQDALLSHCESQRYRFAILDGPAVLNGGSAEKALKGRPRDSTLGAVYFPWIQVFDPVAGKPSFQPPSGFVAGVYARVDAERGVHKAPANEVVRGALDVRYRITRGEQDILNPRGMNCIRSLGDRGIRIWGGRTVSSDPSWRYINVRRLFNMVEQSIEIGTQWVVFEPNDAALWKRISRDVTAYLLRVWKSGAIVGSTPEDAFYVKCDEETNPPEVVDAGQVVIEVGICPTKPAEFVIFRISQWNPQAEGR